MNPSTQTPPASFAETTVMELVTATVRAPHADAEAPARRAQRVARMSGTGVGSVGSAASAAPRAVMPAAAPMPAAASSLLTLAVASLVVVPVFGMALVVARLGGLG